MTRRHVTYDEDGRGYYDDGTRVPAPPLWQSLLGMAVVCGCIGLAALLANACEARVQVETRQDTPTLSVLQVTRRITANNTDLSFVQDTRTGECWLLAHGEGTGIALAPAARESCQ